MLITFSGKGGVGKTSLLALLLDEIVRAGYNRPILAVDGDPATTLHLTLGLPEPAATLAQVRENTPLDARTIRGLPTGQTPAAYVRQRLAEAGVIVHHTLRGQSFDLLAMGPGEDAGCYCAVNNALSQVLASILPDYGLILVDNEAGLEHLSRYRLKRVDLFLVVSTPGSSARAVANRVIQTARRVGMELAEVKLILNRLNGAAVQAGHKEIVAIVPDSAEMAELDRLGQPVVSLPDDDPVRVALRPIVERLCA